MTILKIGAWRELGGHWDGHVRAVGMVGQTKGPDARFGARMETMHRLHRTRMDRWRGICDSSDDGEDKVDRKSVV